jgi:hypothetical protein
MKILIVGDASSVINIGFVKALKNQYAFIEIDFLDVNSAHEKEVRKLYGPLLNEIFCLNKKLPLIRPFQRGPVRVLFNKRVLKEIKTKSFDAVLVQGLFLHQRFVIKRIKRDSNFLIGVLWGSDFYKCKGAKATKRLARAVHSCNLICTMSGQFKDDFLKRFRFSEQNIRVCNHGSSPLEALFEQQNIPSWEAKKIPGFSPEYFIITCGYNARPNQQHLKIIDALVKIKSSLSEQTLLLFPMAYGGNEDYKKQVKAALEKSGLRYHINENFLGPEEVAWLRKATDIFIQTQVTDAYSGSMQEHLFAQNVVITGSWLPYQVLKKKDIYFEEIEDIAILDAKLRYVIENFPVLKEKAVSRNTPDKFKSSLWREVIPKWFEILSEYKVFPK